MRYNEKGHEIHDGKPVVIPAGLKRPVPLAEQMRRMIKNEISRRAMMDGKETFEEADDFDTGDEPELLSPYEVGEGEYKEVVEPPKSPLKADSEAEAPKPEAKSEAPAPAPDKA